MANKTFDKYVHKIGKFWLEGKDDIPFAAQIVCTNSFNYELVGSMIKHDSITEIRRQQSELRGVTLFGVVEGNHISLFNCRIECSSGGADNAKNKFQYYLNCMPVVSTELWPVPSFCLRYDLLKKNFTKILNGWFCFLEEAGPIGELFYQILIDKAQDINLFLNHAQAIEVFSKKN